MSQLLPEGIEHLADCPYPVHEAILVALRLLQYEEFPLDERPPRRIWTDGEKLEAWWKEVDRKRKTKFGISVGDDEDDGGGDYQENAAAAELITRGR